MTNKIYFVNPGEIDLRAVTTMGVNVKLGENPFGEFGTGVKYAIAGVLRLGGQMTIWSGEQAYVFHSLTENIRGKSFDVVHMSSVDGDLTLGFTTDLGKHWEPWMIYRELRSNAMDEGGNVASAVAPAVGTTIVKVDCEAIAQAHGSRLTFWLDSEFNEALWKGHGLEIFGGTSQCLFYHGVRATATENGKTENWQFRYNLTGKHQLTEDRTLASFYSAKQAIGMALCLCDNKEILEAILGEEPESNLDYNHYGLKPSQEFIEVVLDRLRRKVKVSSSARSMVESAEPEKVAEAELDIPSGIDAMLRQEPQVETEIKASKYDWENEMDERMKELETQAVYWRGCALKLAGRGAADA